MHRRQLWSALAVSLAFALGAPAQTSSPDAGTPPSTSTTPAPAKKKTSKKGKKTKAPPPPKQPDIDEETRKALEAAPPPAPPASTTPAAPAPGPAAAPAPAPAPEVTPAPTPAEPQPPADEEPPQLTSTAVTRAIRGHSFAITAHATDPSGVFGPVLYIRKKGLPASEYIPMRMAAAKGGAAGDYAVEIPAPLVSVDTLEYYIEAWDNLGNGPSRVGTADAPLAVKVEEPPKPKEVPKAPEVVKHPGNPPFITHTTVTEATKGKPIELNARLVGETGVSGPAVMFRHVGEREFKALPMGYLGGDDYTATIPGSMATGDIEYYVEAFDKYGNGPARSGAPAVPFVIKVKEPPPPPSLTTQPQGPRLVKAPFRPNFGRAAAWTFMGGFVGGLIFAGGEAFAAGQAHDEYTHTFDFEGRLDDGLLKRANTYGSRAKTALIVSGASLVVGVALLVIFPEYPDTILVPGGGGDIGVRF